MMNINKVIVFIVMLSFTSFALATEIVLTREQVQLAMRPFFPYPLVIGSAKVTLRNPDLVFMQNKQAIRLGLLMDVLDGGEKMQLAGTLMGTVNFDPQTQKIQLIEPVIEKLDVVSGRVSYAEQVINTLKQNIGQSAPVIVLFDLKQLTGGMEFISIKKLRIADNGIALLF